MVAEAFAKIAETVAGVSSDVKPNVVDAQSIAAVCVEEFNKVVENTHPDDEAFLNVELNIKADSDGNPLVNFDITDSVR